jgi:hypothetical protein
MADTPTNDARLRCPSTMSVEQFERLTRPVTASLIPREVLEKRPGYAEERQREIERRLSAIREATAAAKKQPTMTKEKA